VASVAPGERSSRKWRQAMLPLAGYACRLLAVARPRPAELLPSFRTGHGTRAQLFAFAQVAPPTSCRYRWPITADNA